MKVLASASPATLRLLKISARAPSARAASSRESLRHTSLSFLGSPFVSTALSSRFGSSCFYLKNFSKVPNTLSLFFCPLDKDGQRPVRPAVVPRDVPLRSGVAARLLQAAAARGAARARRPPRPAARVCGAPRAYGYDAATISCCTRPYDGARPVHAGGHHKYNRGAPPYVRLPLLLCAAPVSAARRVARTSQGAVALSVWYQKRWTNWCGALCTRCTGAVRSAPCATWWRTCFPY